MTKPGRPVVGEPFNLRLPAAMLAEVDAMAAAEGISRPQWIRQALAARLAAAKG